MGRSTSRAAARMTSLQVVVLAVALGEFAIDVFHHHDGAVDDDSEIDGADGEQVGGYAACVQEDEGKEQAERNGQRDDHRGADADQEKDQHDQNQEPCRRAYCARRCRW